MNTQALKQPLSLRLAGGGFLLLWCLVAIFPLAWIAIMSFKLPVDAFAANPLQVIAGPQTLRSAGGLSVLDIVAGSAVLIGFYQFVRRYAAPLASALAPAGLRPLGWVLCATLLLMIGLSLIGWLLPAALTAADHAMGDDWLTRPLIGATSEHYRSVWIDQGFYQNFLNSLLITAGVVTISLSVGTLAGYALARSGSRLAFWLLIIALIFRALPHSVLVTGYLPAFINSAQWLNPVLGDAAPTLYGQPWAVIFVLVAINQPFTIWMLRSFFENVPRELDEAARVDGCSHIEAFWRVIMPVMWPGVITTGLFSFLLAYNDYLVTALLLDAQNQTMVPAIAGYFNRETTATDQVQAVAAAVSITAPLFVLVMIFQRQIVSGLVQGAVKG